eukprot:1926770-Rhodomonas_salina.1
MGGTLSPKRSLFPLCFRPFGKGFFFVFFSPADEDPSVGDPPPEAEESARIRSPISAPARGKSGILFAKLKLSRRRDVDGGGGWACRTGHVPSQTRIQSVVVVANVPHSPARLRGCREVGE